MTMIMQWGEHAKTEPSKRECQGGNAKKAQAREHDRKLQMKNESMPAH